jgi:hypothetical protein
MAGVNLHVVFLEEETVDTVWKTLATIKAPADRRLRIKGYAIGFDGIAGDAIPIQTRFVDVTVDSGIATISDATNFLDTELIGMTPLPQRAEFTGAPTAGTNILYPGTLHPQGGQMAQIEFDDFLVGGAAVVEVALQIKLVNNQTTVKVSGYISVEE